MKNIPVAPSGKSLAALGPARATMRGRYAIVTERWRGLRWTLAASGDSFTRRNVRSVRRSRVVLAPRPWRLSTPPRGGVATVARKAVHRGEHEGNRKAIARGKPGCLGCTCQTRVHSTATLRTRCCGRSRRPAFPAPSVHERANELAKLRRNPRCENASACFPVIASAAKQSSFLRRDKKAGLLPPSRRGASAES